jgi:hypothetical protein
MILIMPRGLNDQGSFQFNRTERTMTTTTFSHAHFGGRDVLAKPSMVSRIFTSLYQGLVSSRSSQAERIAAQFAGDRWCDSTERALMDQITGRKQSLFD